MSAHVPIALSSQLPLWDRQPGESERNYDAFRRWLALKPSDRLADGYQRIADDTGRRRSTITKTAHHYRWADRAAAYDQHITAINAANDTEQARAAHTHSQQLARRIAALFELGIEQIEQHPDELTPAMVVRLGDLALRWHTAIYGQAPHHVQLDATMGVDANLDVTVRELAEMSPTELAEHTDQLTDSVLRKRTIITSEAGELHEESDAESVAH